MFEGWTNKQSKRNNITDFENHDTTNSNHLSIGTEQGLESLF